MRLFVLAACSVFVTVGTEGVAQPLQNCAGPQLGTWKLQSAKIEDLATGQTTDSLGAHPSGYINYDPDCRMYAILIEEGRKAPASLVPTGAERIELYGGLISYAGAYSIEGDKISHHVDASWNQARTGTTQVRQFRIDGRTLYIRSMPSKSAFDDRGFMQRRIASINDLAIAASERKLHWPLGRRPDDHAGLTALGL